MLKSDFTLLAHWRSGRITAHQLTVAERRRLWQMVLDEANADHRAQAVRDIHDEMMAKKKKTA